MTTAAHQPTADARRAAAKMMEILDAVAETYEAALLAGCDERELFDTTRDKFAEYFPPLQAANLCRCVLAKIAAKYGKELYSRREMELVASRAAGIS